MELDEVGVEEVMVMVVVELLVLLVNLFQVLLKLLGFYNEM